VAHLPNGIASRQADREVKEYDGDDELI